MNKIAYMFPGQGSQFQGMGQALFEAFPNETKKANQLLGYDLVDVCLHDANGHLNDTQYTQPAIYFINCLAYLMQINKPIDNHPDFVLGHSVGEYAALFAAGIFDLYTGLRIVQKRGILMSKVVNGAMMAVIGDKIMRSIASLLETHELNHLDIANFNSPDQVVLSGLKQDIVSAQVLLEDHDYKCVALNVSGAFHSRYMEPVRIDFMRFLMDFEFNIPLLPVIVTSTALPLEANYILEMLGFQLVRSVQWVQSIKYLRALSVMQFIELGPGDVLTKLTSKIF